MKKRPDDMPRPKRGQRYRDLTGDAFVGSTAAGDVWVITEMTREMIYIRPEEMIEDDDYEDGYSRRRTSEAKFDDDLWPPADIEYLAEAGALVDDKAVQAMIVGGAGGRHWQRLFRICGQLGVHALDHVPEDKLRRAPANIRPDVELLIVLVSHGGHAGTDRFIKAAKLARVPYVLVPSQGFKRVLGEYLIEHQELFQGLRSGAPPVNWWWEWTDQGWELMTFDEQSVEDNSTGSLIAAGLAAAAAVFFWRNSPGS
jgi:hypothetical protein